VGGARGGHRTWVFAARAGIQVRHCHIDSALSPTPPAHPTPHPLLRSFRCGGGWQMRELLRDTNFLMLLIAFSIGLGIFNGVLTLVRLASLFLLLPIHGCWCRARVVAESVGAPPPPHTHSLFSQLAQIIRPCDYTANDAGTFGAVLIMSGLVGAGFVGPVRTFAC
jgi:hypothetical protein